MSMAAPVIRQSSRLRALARLVGPLLAAGAWSTAAHAGVVGNPRLEPATEFFGTHEAFDSVGQFTGSTSSGGSYSASGVYLGDGWVLTAAHVVDQASALSFQIGGTDYTADAWAYHSDWNPNDVTAGADLALVKINEPITTGATASLYTGNNEVGAMSYSAGYGLTGTGYTGYDPASGTDTKHAGTNIIDATYGGDVLISDFDSGAWWDNTTGSASPTVLESLIAPGDSGGGLFIVENNQLYLAGIHSFGWGYTDGNANSDFGDLSGHTRVSSYTDWISDIMNTGIDTAVATGSASYGPGSANAFLAVPEPTFTTLLGLATLAVFRRSR